MPIIDQNDKFQFVGLPFSENLGKRLRMVFNRLRRVLI